MNSMTAPAKKAGAPKRKPGRPSTYTPKIALVICDGLTAGKPMREILRRPRMPAARTVLEWLEKEPEFARNYARARGMWAQSEATAIVKLADSCRGKSHEVVNATRVQIDTRKWVIARLLPKIYGDRVDLNVVDQPVDPQQTFEGWLASASTDDRLSHWRRLHFEARLMERDPAFAVHVTKKLATTLLENLAATGQPIGSMDTAPEAIAVLIGQMTEAERAELMRELERLRPVFQKRLPAS